MRRATPLLMLASLAACNPNKPDKATMTDIAADHAVKAGFNPGAPAAMATDSVDPVKAPAPGAMLPPATMKYRYIGRWAGTRGLCTDGVWTFTSKKLSGPDKISCAFPDSATVLSAYELTGECTTHGVKTADVIKLTFDEAKRSMHVESKALGSVDLIYCGA